VWRTLREHWGITRWAVPGVLVGWMGNSIYLYLTGAILGLAATAELNAARLLLMPVGLITVAWFQMARADIARLVGDNDRRKLRGFLAKSLALIFTPILGYFGVLALGYDWVVLLLSADKYGGLQGLTVVWAVYFSVYTVKFIAVGLLVGFEAYRPLLLVSVVSLCLQSGLLLWLPAVYGMPAVVWCLVASESLEMAILWGYLLPKSMKKMTVVRA
jgi:O-antigen/teichoic acid export membrane protein